VHCVIRGGVMPAWVGKLCVRCVPLASTMTKAGLYRACARPRSAEPAGARVEEKAVMEAAVAVAKKRRSGRVVVVAWLRTEAVEAAVRQRVWW
jgi:hypothetical protein